MGTEPPFFILGAARSGTTLLRVMLSSHPQVDVPAESYFIPTLIRGWPSYRRNGRLDIDRVIAAAGPRLDLMQIPREEVRRRIAAKTDPSSGEAIDAIFRIHAEAEGKIRWGDKTPTHVRCMPLIASAFPEAQFVHVIRDGRDVALSSLDQRFGPKTVAEAARHWARRVARARADSRLLLSGAYTEMRYEELVEDPEKTLTNLCGFLGLGYDAAMLDYAVRAPEMILESDRHAHGNIGLPPTKRIRDWRREMPPADVGVFEAVAGGLLEDLGYDRRLPEAPMGARVRAFLWLRIADVKVARTRTRKRMKALTGGGAAG